MGKSGPHPVDVHVGRKLRSRRTILGMSQEDLGEAVNITFQQVQKYERGFNRMGASRLYEFSCILNVDVAYFFEDYDVNSPTDTNKNSLLDTDEFTKEYERSNNKEVLTLIRAYYGISSEKIRKKILSLVKSISSNRHLDMDEDEVEEKNSAVTPQKTMINA
jgi:transcriptional regulator with XRE-family HTH domain